MPARRVTNGTHVRSAHARQQRRQADRRPRALAAERRRLTLGGSAARGAYVADAALATATLHRRNGAARAQQALGVDAEYSRDHWLVRGELIWNRWQVPTLSRDARRARARSSKGATRFRRHVRRRAASIASASASCASSFGTRTWDAPVTRLETGVGYYIRRNLLAKGAYQHNWRDGGPVTSRGLFAAQLHFWL